MVFNFLILTFEIFVHVFRGEMEVEGSWVCLGGGGVSCFESSPSVLLV
jgi:hypothetical protein